jgi:hypothetical protein
MVIINIEDETGIFLGRMHKEVKPILNDDKNSRKATSRASSHGDIHGIGRARIEFL